ncbi:MAG: hypothetical protein IJJ41_08320 [Clostridia bacterium]|nr:hypothetical protein [Clostridia bacterium]
MKKNNNVICPVCGKYTFCAHNNYDICKYCGWENEDYYDGGGANELSLEECRKRYQRAIADNPNFIWENGGYPEENYE